MAGNVSVTSVNPAGRLWNFPVLAPYQPTISHQSAPSLESPDRTRIRFNPYCDSEWKLVFGPLEYHEPDEQENKRLRRPKLSKRVNASCSVAVYPRTSHFFSVFA